MIDINELRRLAQAATPHVGHACNYQDAHWLREGHVDFENADLFIASERPQEDAAFYAAANPAAISELINRLEAAEKTNREWLRANAPGGWIDNLRIENDALRAKIAEMEKQAPVAIQHRVPSVDFRGECVGYSEWKDGKGLEHWPHRTLYALPGAAPETKP